MADSGGKQQSLNNQEQENIKQQQLQNSDSQNKEHIKQQEQNIGSQNNDQHNQEQQQQNQESNINVGDNNNNNDENFESYICNFCVERDNLGKKDQILSQNQIEFSCCQQCFEQQIKEEDQKQFQLEKSIELYQKRLETLDTDIKASQQMFPEQEEDEILKQELLIDQQIKEQLKLEEEQDLELQKLKNEVLKLEMEESQYWNKINSHQKNFVKLEEKVQQADSYLKKLTSDIENINKINVLNDAFHIYTEEQAGTINGLLIGKRKDQQNIDWDITNAGLGQLCVLITYLAQKFSYKFGYIEYINCNGNFSNLKPKIQQTGNVTVKVQELNFYGPVGKESPEDLFNQAITIFLQEFKLFCDYLSKYEAFQKFNIKIELPNDIRSDNSAIIQGNQSYILNTRPNKGDKEPNWDHWTQTFKYLLTDFKYIISVNARYDCLAEQEYIQQL